MQLGCGMPTVKYQLCPRPALGGTVGGLSAQAADGRTDGRTIDRTYLGWSLSAQVVFLLQLAALQGGRKQPLSRREINAMPANPDARAAAGVDVEYAPAAFGLAHAHLVQAGIVSPGKRGQRPTWAPDAQANAARWVALMTGEKQA